ncbi:hypothetical protein D3Z51_18870 [Clostridiaceae bacterium]|nr:hypothetical protein [Clostridiaceae bacterium]RKI08718.1 hypothetical protein D7V81_18585 [bacterium 1XD21-70]
MSNYRRLISYIYAYEGGVKGKNIGFAKIEIRNGQCRIHVNVKRIFLGNSDIGVYLLSSQKEILLGRIFIRNGAGEFRTNVNAGDVENSGYGMEQCYGLTIHETESTWRTYTTIWEDAVAQAAEVELANVTAQEAKRQPEGEEGFSVSEEIRRELEEEDKEDVPWKTAGEDGSGQQDAENVAAGEEPGRDTAAEIRGGQPDGGQPQGGTEGLREKNPESGEGQANAENPVSGETAAGTGDPADRTEASGQESPPGAAELQNAGNPLGAEPLAGGIDRGGKASEEDGWKKGAVTEPLWRGGTPPGEEIPRSGQDSVQEKVLKFARVLLQGRSPAEGGNSGQEAAGNQVPTILQMPSPPAPPTAIKKEAAPSRPDPGDPARLAELDRLEQEEMDRGSIWNQLQRRYAKVLAFEYTGGCEILSIKPQDIGMLPRENWIYGNNSFLLHGYYNYRHLILARLENPNGEPRYLLGVPGHYFSNEKNLASMFGFPYFVLAKKQPEQDGRFGYWYTDLRL